MYPYMPKLSHAIVTAAICILVIALGARAQGRVLTALTIGAFIFAIMTAVILGLLILEGLNRRVEVMINFAKEIGKLDDEARAMMAFEFPHMQYRMKRGQVRAYFEDTNVTIEMFRLFLQSSNAKYISPRRDWYTTEKPEWAWVEIYEWLVDHDKIIPDSAAGNVSHLWKGYSYQHLCAYWMAGRQLTEMRDIQVFASETEGINHLPTA